MDTLFRLVSFHQPQAAAAPYPSPDQQLQQQSPYSSRLLLLVFVPAARALIECPTTHAHTATVVVVVSARAHAHTAPSTSSTGGHGGLFEAADFSFPSVDIDLDFSSTPASPSAATAGTTWATQLLLECARAVAARDSQRVQQLMACSRASDVIGPPHAAHARAASDRNTSFESTRRTALRFQELSPWASFGHVAANGSILESFLAAAAASSSSEQQRLHILDLSNTFCTQWPTLLEALATRSSDETPHLSITTVVPAGAQRVMPEIAQRLEKFARLMGVPFAFRVVHHAGDLAALDLGALLVQDDDNLNTTAALAVNCVNALRGVAPAGRDAFLASVRRLDPRVVTVVEEEADLFVASMDSTTDSEEDAFVKVFGEGLRFFTSYMDSLEESFPKNEQ
ncbi:hypothetical protein PR202_ga31007 [Eleusine coracana subsp. coracana]|uniref:Protein SHORT-ROOT 1 n=1 Tax=Eleusine coracana subsp. coracana TaxID=191504 RepID=A0AAV5DRG8_ELECO|nr:hypothetical protein PR202_ga31007 [Eleusine coracana subsp. coracana]